jgi:transposase
VKQSGVSIHGKGRITKRGNVILRHMLYQAAFIARRHDAELGAYYKKKRSEGMHHTAALCAVERKLIHRIFAVWKRGTPYVKTPKT